MNSRPETDEAIGLVGATLAAARGVRFAAATRLPGARLRPISLARYASDPAAPLKIVGGSGSPVVFRHHFPRSTTKESPCWA